MPSQCGIIELQSVLPAIVELWSRCQGTRRRCQKTSTRLLSTLKLWRLCANLSRLSARWSDQKVLPAPPAPPPSPNLTVNSSRLLARSWTEPFRISLRPREEKLLGALKGKAKREAQVELFGKLIQHLHHLVPIETTSRTATVNQVDSSWKTEVRDTLQGLEGKAHTETRRELHAWIIVWHPPFQ